MADDIGVIYSKVNKLDERVTRLESTRPYLEKLIERNIDSNEKLSNALSDMQGFMKSMNTKIDMQSDTIKEIKSDVIELDNKIARVEEKGKFDMMDYIRKNLPLIIVALSGFALYASAYVKV